MDPVVPEVAGLEALAVVPVEPVEAPVPVDAAGALLALPVDAAGALLALPVDVAGALLALLVGALDEPGDDDPLLDGAEAELDSPVPEPEELDGVLAPAAWSLDDEPELAPVDPEDAPYEDEPLDEDPELLADEPDELPCDEPAVVDAGW